MSTIVFPIVVYRVPYPWLGRITVYLRSFSSFYRFYWSWCRIPYPSLPCPMGSCLGPGQIFILTALDFAWFLLFIAMVLSPSSSVFAYLSLFWSCYISPCLESRVGWRRILAFTWLDFVWFLLLSILIFILILILTLSLHALCTPAMATVACADLSTDVA